MRGEHAAQQAAFYRLVGSSPHARGATKCPASLYRITGIIPACAGSTVPIFSLGFVPRDHPRMRGEHIHVDVRTALHVGSSPHARGARALLSLVMAAGRIIPACAGSTEFVCLCHGFS